MDFKPIIGNNIGARYKILDIIGKGTFSVVTELWDRLKKKRMAGKIIKSGKKYSAIAVQEYYILEYIKQSDPDDHIPIIKVIDLVKITKDTQPLAQHLCLFFPVAGISLYSWIYSIGPFPIQIISNIARQILVGLDFLHNKIHLIHTDIKLENIVVDESDEQSLDKTTKIRIIDFGNCVDGLTNHNTVASTRNYRAPEIIMKNDWNYQIDMWSLGCVLYELYTGRLLFQAIDDNEHLSQMNQILGPLPYECNLPQPVYKLQSLNSIILGTDDFKNLLFRLLDYNPITRIKPDEALKHPFISLQQH